MVYTRKCIWCGTEFKTEDVELDYCSVSCHRADEENTLKELEERDW